MKIPRSHVKQLWALFASIENEQEAKTLMTDILTPQEIDSIAERWQIIQELEKGHPQRDIAKKLNISIAKITRGSRMLKYGGGGFKHFLEKLKKIK